MGYTSPRYSNMYGALSQSVTTVFPQNPFNQRDMHSETTNGSLDSRSFAKIQHFSVKQHASPVAESPGQEEHPKE